MFTGIVEEKGIVQSVEKKNNLFSLTIFVKKILKDSKIGDSIAVDGVCLTIVSKRGKTLVFDMMKETIDKTTLQYLKKGSLVNLERSLKFGSRLGGHFVSGHVDDVGVIKKKITLPNYVEFQISMDRKLMHYVVPKGSICIDGISLTIGCVQRNYFSVYIIPHTLKMTTLGAKKPLDKINIETDIVAKYIIDKKKIAKLFQGGFFRYNKASRV